MRWVRLAGWIFGGLVGLVALAGIAVWVGGAPVVTWVIEHPASSAIGRQIRIGGKLAITWGAPTRIVVEDIHLANASWGSEPEMFAAKRLEIDLFVRSLLFGPAHITLVDLEGAALLLETSERGQGNWDFGLKSAAPQKRGQFPVVDKVVIGGSGLRYRNGVTKAESDLGLTRLQVDAPDPHGTVRFAAEGSLQKLPLRLSGTTGPLAELRNPTKPYPVTFDGTLDQMHLVTDGTIAEPLDVDGIDMRLSLSGAKLSEVASAVGVPLPEVPDFRGTGKLTGGNGAWDLKALSLVMGKSDLEGGLAVDTNAKVPHVEANLTSSGMDLADFKGFYGGKPARSSAPTKAPAPSDRVLPNTPIDVHKLPGLNADITFDATRIMATGGLPIERISFALQLKDGMLTIKPLRFQIAQGEVDLNAGFTPFTTSGPPHLTANIDVRHVDLHRLLGGPSMPDIVRQAAGIVGGFVKIDTSGVSTSEFLGRMNGDAAIFMANGQLSQLLEQLAPIDVLGALGVYARGDKPVPINCLVTRFNIKSGVASVATMLADTPDDQIAGTGSINFADETVALTLTPRNKNFTVVSLRTPVDIGGTFKKPEFHLKAEGLVARLGAAVGLGILFPPAALLPLIDTGLGQNNACAKAYAEQKPPGQPPAPAGSSTQSK